jgi:hypothetical protein
MTTRTLRLPPARGPVPFRLPPGTGTLLIGLVVAVLLGLASVKPEWWRGLLAAGLTMNGIVLAMRWPRAAAILTLLWLPFVALIRRLLIADGGWVANDLLLLVGPLIAIFLCYRLFLIERRPLAPDRLSKLVVLLLVMACLWVFHPLGAGGVLGGLAGLIFVGVPLLWFLIGRELGNRQTVARLMYAVVILSVLIACYGLYQTKWGTMPSWDLDWFHVAGYNAVVVDTNSLGELQFRPWGTFSSNSEYSAYLGIALVITVALLYHRKFALAITAPLLTVAVFLSGGRSVMALLLLTGVVLTALLTRNRVLALIVVVLGIGVIYGAALALGPRIDRAAGLSGNAVSQRNVGGLLKPLDPQQSTFLTHWDNFGNAVTNGFTNPAGHGSGYSNLGGRIGGGGGIETDIDIGDTFVNFGFVGGLLFVAIIVMSFGRVFGGYLRRPDWRLLAVGGILVVSFGQWLQGGHYATSGILWFLLGWAAAATRQPGREEQPLLPTRFAGWHRWLPWRSEPSRRAPAFARPPDGP